MIKLIKTESKKFLDIRYLLLLTSAPLLISILTAIQTAQIGASSFSAGGSNSIYVISQNLSLWSLLLIIPFVAVITIYLAYVEHSNNTWKLLFSLKVSRGKLLLSKVIFYMISVQFVYLMLFVFTTLEVALLPSFIKGFSFEASDLVYLAARVVLLSFVTTLVGLFHYAIALLLRNPVFPFVVAILIMLINFMVVNSSIAYLYPWSLITLSSQYQLSISIWQVLLSPVILASGSLFIILRVFPSKDF